MTSILTLNAGSSSLKFAVYQSGACAASGQVEQLGPAAILKLDKGGKRELGATDHARALSEILTEIGHVTDGAPVNAVGHRIVHGGVDFSEPMRLTETVIQKLKLLIPLAPLHQPHNLESVKAAIAAFPDAVQVGCFDTAFHRSHPWVNDTFALPRRYYDAGVRRYGFHGLSYHYITDYVRGNYPKLADGRLVIAHLGNGASMCAVQHGLSVASTMGFSALDGLPMGTRCGQLDPGVMLYLLDHEKLGANEISNLLYKESGLLGLSGVSSDMRTLEASNDPKATEAIDYFVFRITREIGAMAASMGGIDALIFSGGIGENSATIRKRVADSVRFLGIECDDARNESGAEDFGKGQVRLMRIETDEEQVIADACAAILNE